MILRQLIHKQRGLTLPELLMALVTSGIILGAMVSSFISQQKIYASQEQASEMTLSARAALDMIIRDIRTTGLRRLQRRLWLRLRLRRRLLWRLRVVRRLRHHGLLPTATQTQGKWSANDASAKSQA